MLARSFGILIGYMLACVAFELVLVSFVFTPYEFATDPSGVAAERLSQAARFVALGSVSVMIIAAVPALIGVVIAEARRIDNWLYYVICAVLIAGLGLLAQHLSEAQGQPTIVFTYAIAALLCGGVVAGTVYWLVIGRTAGRPRSPPTEAPPSARASTPDPEKA